LADRVISRRRVIQFIFNFWLDRIHRVNQLIISLTDGGLLINIRNQNFWYFSIFILILNLFMLDSLGCHPAFHVALVSGRIRVSYLFFDNLWNSSEDWLSVIVKLKDSSVLLISAYKVPQS
jgi:hypothetical protein